MYFILQHSRHSIIFWMNQLVRTVCNKCFTSTVIAHSNEIKQRKYSTQHLFTPVYITAQLTHAVIKKDTFIQKNSQLYIMRWLWSPVIIHHRWQRPANMWNTGLYKCYIVLLRHDMEMSSALLPALPKGNPTVIGGSPSQRASNGSFDDFIHVSWIDLSDKQSKLPAIWVAMTPMWRSRGQNGAHVGPMNFVICFFLLWWECWWP